MPVYYVNETPQNRVYEERIPNGKYRYIGRFSGIRFDIHANTRKTEEDVYAYLESKPIESLINAEGYIISIE